MKKSKITDIDDARKEITKELNKKYEAVIFSTEKTTILEGSGIDLIAILGIIAEDFMRQGVLLEQIQDTINYAYERIINEDEE